ncbi:hypothetical protein AAF712_001952 [Marasmius tenuissimus]|uniref:Transmembrane protein n=1 Tax=Marasmius tenuissimus TaxID=585030 RepID=A0ABR3A9V3_9AGAR
MLHVSSKPTLNARAVGSILENHPDFNTISAFFLGCVFWVAFQSLISTELAGRFAQLVTRRRSLKSVPDVEAPAEQSGTKSVDTSERDPTLSILLFALFLSFVLSSISDLVSLMSGKTEALCAFSVSWGKMASKFGRLLGLVVLLVMTHRLKALPRWEVMTVMFWLLATFVLILVDGALNTGTVEQRVLAASLISSLSYIFLELYFIARLATILFPRLSQEKNSPIMALLQDNRLQKVIALLLFELLTVVPLSVEVSTVGLFVPVALGTLVVMIAFGSRCRPDHRNEKPSGDQRSLSFSEKLPSSPIRVRASNYLPTIDLHSVYTHPSAVVSPGTRTAEEPTPPTARSNMTFESSHTQKAQKLHLQANHPTSLRPGSHMPPANSRQETSSSAGRQHSFRSVFSRRGRPKLTIITRLSKYNLRKPPLPKIPVQEPCSPVDTIYSFYSNTPRSAPVISRFSPSSSEHHEPRSASSSSSDTLTPRAYNPAFSVSEGRPVVDSAWNGPGQPRALTQTPTISVRPMGPRSQTPGPPKITNLERAR